ncbi:TolC family protein [Pedobacter alluvionis]|uniref:Outer membrane protein TolC n=1 Tax=Pedobacter alluvionis TaxID=475253 RepID=A0A497YF75_9SPHI|nr:TolC family protein [Pedobacter alluvionis]RLJ80059.1 outer membrane protein TolC [Pedobacter alluvionis]TFB31355.1 TolC family protein [Pedobacter alluvionis]
MKNLNKTWIIFLLWSIAQVSAAQDTLRLSHPEFLSIVKKYHPLAFKYRLQNNITEAEVLKARGNFDPVVDAKKGGKTIDGTNYYEQSNAGLVIPTWYGIEVSGSYNYIDGQRLNNSDTRGGLYQFGLTIPLAKNLIYDKRRAMLDQAKFAQVMTAAEQQVLTNELFRDAENAYWQWVKCYELYLVQKRAVAINQNRLSLTLKTFQYGERAAIDTTETLSQLRGFELEKEDAYLQYVKATMDLSVYLWKEGQQPFEITKPLLPSESITVSEAYDRYSALIAQLNAQPVNSHLSLVYYQQKQKILESERKLKWQSFLPKIDFTYNFFNKENYQTTLFPLFQNNYQYGLKLEIPIFLRQARADYSQAKMKVMQNRLDADLKRQELNAKISNYSNEVVNYRNQIKIAQQNIGNYNRLLQAEETKYQNGESSLFLINSRENKLIDAQEKMLELRFKFLKSYNELKFMSASFGG